MKIVIVTPSISRAGGGVSEAIRLLATGLEKNDGVEVEILTLRDEHFDDDKPALGKITVRAFQFFGPANYGFSPGLLLATLRSRADVIHVHSLWMFHCFAVLIWSYVTGGTYVVTPHGMLEKWIRMRSPVLKRLVSALYQNRFIRRASCVHLLTEKEVQDLVEAIGELPHVVIPNYVVISTVLRTERKPKWWRAEWDHLDVYLYLGRIHEKKGCRELCLAWDTICSTDPEFKRRSVLVFCGWIDGLADFEATVALLANVHGNAVFVGPQYGVEKDQALAAATFVVLPSRSEGLPLVVLESWAKGKPTIMTEACNVSAGFSAGAALRVGEEPSSIVDSLAAASRTNAEQRNLMSASARRLARERYSEEVVVTMFAELYKRVAKGNAAEAKA